MVRARWPVRCCTTIVATVAAALLLSDAATAQVTFEPRGNMARYVPPRDDAGSWDGTWWYVNRESKIALWIRTENGMPQIKLRYVSTNWAEGFETDWEGASDYVTKLGPGKFRMTLGERDANSIAGRWDWTLESPGSTRVEAGTFALHRTNTGRGLAFVFEELLRSRRTVGRPEVGHISAPSLTFTKGSTRLVLWDELPF